MAYARRDGEIILNDARGLIFVLFCFQVLGNFAKCCCAEIRPTIGRTKPFCSFDDHSDGFPRIKHPFKEPTSPRQICTGCTCLYL